jgi:hypothetical protein
LIDFGLCKKINKRDGVIIKVWFIFLIYLSLSQLYITT